MKKIINGKRYDTEASVLVAQTSNNNMVGRGDFRWYDETLYQTPRSKTFFLAGEGGAMSRWAESAGQNSWTGGEGIRPLSTDDAREWCEDAGVSVETIERFFDIEEA